MPSVLPMATAGFDAAISRFGVMFFDDPVAAFSNVARALSPGGSMTFVCWQLFSNDWIRVPGLALAEHVPLPDLGPPGGPGLFSLADPDRIGSVLGSAGFSDVEIEPLHEMILLGGGGPLDETVEFLRHGSMARAVLQDADPEVEVEAIAAATKALQPFVTQSGVEIGTAAWLVYPVVPDRGRIWSWRSDHPSWPTGLTHVNPITSHGNAFGMESLTLCTSQRDGTVGAHHPMPRHVL